MQIETVYTIYTNYLYIVTSGTRLVGYLSSPIQRALVE